MPDVLLEALLFLSTYGCFVLVQTRVGISNSAASGHADGLDMLRGISANFVFCAHTARTYALFERGSPVALDPSLQAAADLGDFGVAVFFLITGYLFMGVAFPKHTSLSGARTFLFRRGLRLSPAFFAIAAIAFAFHVAYLHAIGSARGPGYYVASLIRLFSFGSLHKPLLGEDRFLWHMINMSWSLKYEWIFYLIVAAAALSKRKVVLPIACLVFAVLGRVIDVFNIFNCMSLFCFGGAVAWAGNSWRRLAIVAVAGALFCVLSHSVAPLLALTLVIGFSRKLPVPRLLMPFAEAGKVTYSYYLFHGSVLLVVYVACGKLLRPDTLYQPGLYVFGLIGAAVSAVVASVAYRLFELPYFLRRRVVATAPQVAP